MAFSRRNTSADGLYCRAWTCATTADLAALAALVGNPGAPHRGDFAFVTANSTWYVWTDDNVWQKFTPLAAADLSNGVTGSGAIVLATTPALLGTPTAPTPAATDNSTTLATTAYVTTGIANAIAAVNPAMAVQAATNAILPNSPVYVNGVSGIGATITSGSVNTTLVVDGYTPLLGDRILVKNESSGGGLGASKNGVYTVTTLGALAVKWVLTRALDYDQPSDINNTGAIPVVNGTANAQTQWVVTSAVATIGIDPITYTQFSLNPTTLVTAASALTSTALVIGSGGQAEQVDGNWTIEQTGHSLSSSKQPRASAYNSAVQSVPTGAFTTITFDSEDFNVGAMHSTSVNSSRMTVPTGGAGLYYIRTKLRFALAGETQVAIQLLKNGSAISIHDETPVSDVEVSSMQVLAAGDYIEVQAFHDAAGNINIGSGVRQAASELQIVKLW